MNDIQNPPKQDNARGYRKEIADCVKSLHSLRKACKHEGCAAKINYACVILEQGAALPDPPKPTK